MLPSNVMDRLFTRMSMVYGTEWSNRWRGIPEEEVKESWSKELSSVSVEELTWAVKNLPVHAPNLIQFKELCRQAPKKTEIPVVEWNGRTDEVQAKAALEQAGVVINKPKMKDDGREWARRILRRRDAGELFSMAVITMAEEGLKARFI